jgi:hypothetical protein
MQVSLGKFVSGILELETREGDIRIALKRITHTHTHIYIYIGCEGER